MFLSLVFLIRKMAAMKPTSELIVTIAQGKRQGSQGTPGARQTLEEWQGLDLASYSKH